MASRVLEVNAIHECFYDRWGALFKWIWVSLVWLLGRRLCLPTRMVGANRSQAGYLTALAECDMVVAIAGYSMYDCPIAIVSRLFNYVLAKWAGKKTVLLAQTINPSNRNWVRKLVRVVAHRLELVTVRDSTSLSYLSPTEPQSHICRTSDLAWLINEGAGQLDTRSNVSTSEYVIISARDLKEDRADRYVTFMARLADYIVEELGYRIMFVSSFVLPQGEPHDGPLREGAALRPDDADVAKTIRARCRHANSITVIDDNVTVERTLELIGQARFTIASRMHMCIFAMQLGIPVLGVVAYSRRWLTERGKWKGAFHDLGLETFLIDWETTPWAEVVLLITWIENRRDAIVSVIASQAREARRRSNENFRLLEQLTKGQTAGLWPESRVGAEQGLPPIPDGADRPAAALTT